MSSPEMATDQAPSTAGGDPLLASLVFLTRHFGHPRSADVLKAGLPDSGETLTPTQFTRAAERVGLQAEVLRKSARALKGVPVPAVLMLNKGKAAILMGFEGGRAQVIMPNSGKARSADIAQIEKAFTGYVITVRKDPRMAFLDDKNVSQKTEKGHWFWSALAKNWWIYAQVALSASLVNFFALATPIFIMSVYDRVVPNNAVETLWALAMGVSVVFLFDFLIRSVRAYLIDTAGQDADLTLASRIYDRVLDIQLAARPQSSGAFANTLREFEAVRDFFTSASLATVVDIPFILLFIFFVSFIGGQIAFILIAAVIIMFLICLLLHLPLRSVVRQAYQDGTTKHSVLVESVGGLETIKSIGAEGRMRYRWESAVALNAKSSSRARFLSMLAINATQFVHHMTTVAIIVGGYFLFQAGEMSPGGMIACVILSTRALAPMSGVANLLVRGHQALSALRGLDKVMAAPSERPYDKSFFHRPKLAGAIEFQDISFAYPGQEMMALANIRFKITEGEHVAFIGRIGSGKSTIHKLILGLYGPQAGSILIDGTDIRQLDPADLRRNIGYVPQDIVLFRGTVRENIAIAAPEADDAQVLQAAQLSGVDDFLRRHPLGYDLPVGERGEMLSGGQRQAIGLARALIHDPPILLLDEPTSSMDTAAENAFRTRLEAMLPGKTLILVTHRNAMLPLIQRLFVLDQGKLVAEGPRDKVLKALSTGQISQAKLNANLQSGEGAG